MIRPATASPDDDCNDDDDHDDYDDYLDDDDDDCDDYLDDNDDGDDDEFDDGAWYPPIYCGMEIMVDKMPPLFSTCERKI